MENNKTNDGSVKFSPSFIKEGVFLSKHSTFKIGGTARFFVEVHSLDDLKKVFDFLTEKKLPVFFLGGGSNTVFDDEGHKGVVIKNCIKGIEILRNNNDGVSLKVGAGEIWDDLVDFCVKNNFGGLENLTAIPGTVGGAVVQNIGAYGVEIKDFVESVDIIDLKKFDLRTIKKTDLLFGYRHSIFKQNDFKDMFIVSTIFSLKKDHTPNLSYKDLKVYFDGRNETDVNIKEVRDALKVIRGNKFPNLNTYGTAGSFFKNTIVNKTVLVNLQKEFGEIPFFEVDGENVKIPTGFILEKICGLRGFKDGNFGLYENQSLVVVNFGEGTSKDLKEFISKIKQIVFEKTKIILEEEVIVL